MNVTWSKIPEDMFSPDVADLGQVCQCRLIRLSVQCDPSPCYVHKSFCCLVMRHLNFIFHSRICFITYITSLHSPLLTTVSLEGINRLVLKMDDLTDLQHLTCPNNFNKRNYCLEIGTLFMVNWSVYNVVFLYVASLNS